MQRSFLVRVITALFISALVAGSLGGANVLAQDPPEDVVGSWSLNLTQTCEGFSFSHQPFSGGFGPASGYTYRITGVGAVAETTYTANQVISVTYEDSSVSNFSEVTIWATYENPATKQQLGQHNVFSEPCVVEPPFEGVMVYSPVITQTCEGFTYSHTNFRSPDTYLGDAERYEIVITGDGAIERHAYQPDTVISVTYEDSSVQHSSEVRLFADYGNGTWFQLGVTKIAPQPCEIEEPGDNGDEDPDNGDEEPDNGDEDPGGNGDEEPGDNGDEEPGDNGDEEPGDTGSEEPGDNGDVSTGTDEETPATDDTEIGTNDEVTADAEDADPAGDPVEVSGLPSTGSGPANAGLLALASVAVMLMGGAAMITRLGIVRR